MHTHKYVHQLRISEAYRTKVLSIRVFMHALNDRGEPWSFSGLVEATMVPRGFAAINLFRNRSYSNNHEVIKSLQLETCG